MSSDLRVIIAGGGRIGAHAAAHLDQRGHDVVIIEHDPDRCAVLNDRFVATVIDGDATRPGVLRQAEPERSDVLAAVIGDSPGTNVGICATAERLAPDINTVARIDNEAADEYGEVVDRVLEPAKPAAHVATNQILDVTGGGVRTVEAVTDTLELVEITVAEGAPAAGKRLESVSFPRGAVVVADCREGAFPGPETVLDPGTPYIIAVRGPVSDEVVRLLRG